MAKRITYFAYGSNLDRTQMRQRCPSATIEAVATLPKHRLIFGGFSRAWGSPVASVIRDEETNVPGVLYSMDLRDLDALDRCEGVPHVYERVTRIVVDDADRRRRVQVYQLAGPRFVTGMPHLRYFHTIRRAYERHGFDDRILLDAAFWEIS